MRKLLIAFALVCCGIFLRPAPVAAQWATCGPAGQQCTNGDVFMSGSRPWCDIIGKGAIPDNAATDSTAAIQACVNEVSARGGVVFIPPGGYCVKTGPIIVSTVGTTIRGAGTYVSTLDACGTNSAIVQMGARRNALEDLTIFGQQSFTANKVAIQLTPGCNECYLNRIVGAFGSSVLDINGSPDVYVEDVFLQQAYGTNMIYVHNSAVVFFHRAKLDHSYPGSGVAPLALPVAWAPGTVYPAGRIVSNAGFYMQSTVGGTSGGSLPALQFYNTNITDGSVTWQLLGPTAYANVTLDGAIEAHFLQTDITGFATTGVNITGGTVLTHFASSIISSQFFNGIFGNTGSSLYVVDTELNFCILTGCSILEFGASWSGRGSVVSNNIAGSATVVGIQISGGGGIQVNGNTVYGVATGVNLVANINNIQVVGNSIASTGSGINIAAGTSDYLTITGNQSGGVGTILTSGTITGTHNTIYGNDGSAVPLRNGGTGAALTAVNGALAYSTGSALALSSATTANGVIFGGSPPGSTAAGTNGQLLLGVTGSAPTFATMSGEATITNAGVLTLATAIANAHTFSGIITYSNGSNAITLSTDGSYIGWGAGAATNAFIQGNASTNTFTFGTASTNRMTIKAGVDIGTSAFDPGASNLGVEGFLQVGFSSAQTVPAGAIFTNSYVRTNATTVAGLGTCGAGQKGARWFVTDNNTALAFAAVITSGGTIQTPVYCDGTTWRQGANDNAPAAKLAG